jgi:death-on-curing protein
MIRYLSAEDLLVVHALVIDETTGSHGVREAGLLQSIVERPKAAFGGTEVHPNIFAKAAALSEAIVNYHVFVDGNKRTGLVAMARFLEVNGYVLQAENKELENTMVAVATKKLLLEEFAEWIAVHVETQGV